MKIQPIVEQTHITVCRAEPGPSNDFCITQNEDNNHDEINYPAGYAGHSVQCPEDKILNHIIPFLKLNLSFISVLKHI